MSELTLLQQVLESHKRFRAGSPQPLPSSGDPFLVVTCTDANLTGLIEHALGLPRDRALVLRTAGSSIAPPDPGTLRSIASALYVNGCREVILVGHIPCSMIDFSTAEIMDRFRKEGIPRSSFGDGDLREWFGAIGDARSSILQSVDYIRRSEIWPRSRKIHGLVLDQVRGAVDVVFDGDKAQLEIVSPAEPEPASKERGKAVEVIEPPEPREIPPPPVRDREPEGPVVIPEARARRREQAQEESSRSLADAVLVLRDVFVSERQDPQFNRLAIELSALLRKERNPVRILSAVEGIVSKYESRYPHLRGSLETLRRSVQARNAAGINFIEFMKRLLE